MDTLKKTKGREAILEVLEKEKTPVDVGHIQNHLDSQRISVNPATVYRILDAFFKQGIVHRLEFREGKYRYELASKEDHHHLICQNCDKIEDISDCNIKKLEKEINAKKGFLVKHHSLEFFGLCSNCQR